MIKYYIDELYKNLLQTYHNRCTVLNLEKITISSDNNKLHFISKREGTIHILKKPFYYVMGAGFKGCVKTIDSIHTSNINVFHVDGTNVYYCNEIYTKIDLQDPSYLFNLSLVLHDEIMEIIVVLSTIVLHDDFEYLYYEK